MSTRKYWILASFAIFILLPAWLNASLIPSLLLIGNTSLSLLAEKIPRIALSASLLLAEALAIYFFGKKAAIPDTFTTRYGPFIVPIIFTIVAWLLISFIDGGNFTHVQDIYGLYVFTPFFLFVIIALITGTPWLIPVAAIASYMLFAFLFALGTWCGKRFRTQENKPALYLLALILALGTVAVAQHAVQYRNVLRHDPNHPGVSENHWEIQRRYAPFKAKPQLASPQTPPPLQIDSDYPRLDGAVAFYPVYAAAANAIYREGEAAAKAETHARSRRTPGSCSTGSWAPKGSNSSPMRATSRSDSSG